jgi:hypothetical protein
MKIRLLVSISGTRDGLPWPSRGEVVDLPNAEALHMIEQGQAESVSPDDVETATLKPTENAARRTGKR